MKVTGGEYDECSYFYIFVELRKKRSELSRQQQAAAAAAAASEAAAAAAAAKVYPCSRPSAL